jgi:hypothetical protein
MRSGKQIWGESIREQTTGAFSFPRRSQCPPKPHKHEKSHLTLPGKRITMKSPKDIAKAAFMGGWFLCALFRWAWLYDTSHSNHLQYQIGSNKLFCMVAQKTRGKYGHNVGTNPGFNSEKREWRF